VLGWASLNGGTGVGGSPQCLVGLDGPAITASNVLVAPGCFVTPPCASCATSPLASIDVLSPAHLGTNATLTIGGTPGDLLFLAADLDHRHVPVPGFDVPFVLTPNAVTLGFVPLPGSGYASWPVGIPNQPVLLHLELFFQGAALDVAAATVRLTGPASFHIH
jgi:hypothetical protein